jgi:L-fuculose-phosphate aldolase
MLPEAVVSLGPTIPTVPLSMPGSESVQSVAPYLAEYDALLLAGNGVLSCGTDLEMAYLRMELVEHLARIALVANQLGGPRSLPPHFLRPLLDARARAGLGPEARGLRTTPPPANEAQTRAPDDLETIIREEVRRTLGDKT